MQVTTQNIAVPMLRFKEFDGDWIKKKLSDLKLNHAVSPIENPLQIREIRRVISRISTAMTMKKLKSK